MDEVKPVARVPTVEHREPCESRGSRTVLGAPGGEIPPGDSTISSESVVGRVSRGSPVQTAMRNCTRDEGRSFEAGSQVLASNRCKLLSSKAMVVSVAANVGTNPSG